MVEKEVINYFEDIRAARCRLLHQPASALILHQEIARRLIAHLTHIKIEPLRILELGGAGSCLQPLIKSIFPKAQIFSLDLCAVSPGKRLWSRFSKQGVQPLIANPLALPLQPNSVDLIISNLFLFWWQDLLTLFQGLGQVLSTEGLLLFSSLGPDSLQQLRLEQPPLPGFFDMHDVGDQLMQAGLTQPVLEMEQLTLEYPSAEAMQRDVTAWQLQPWATQASPTAKDDHYPLTFEVLYGHAWAPGKSSKGTKTNGVSTIAVGDITLRSSANKPAI